VLAVSLLGASAAAVLLLAFWLAPLWRAPQLRIAPAPTPQAPPLAAELKPAASAAAQPMTERAPGLPLSRREQRSVAGQHPARPATSAVRNAPPAALAVADAAELPQIAEAPRSGFVYPVAPNPNLVGKVVLKAVVGSDGAVKQVAVLSGDRALAAAAVRAVRQWRYAPAEVGGRTVEAETHVTISFLGDDAVSIIVPEQR